MEGMPDAAHVMRVINREEANTFGVSFADINNAITANVGSSYINDNLNAGRMQRVILQAEDRSNVDCQ
ncbi:efflux RND transporter permease subunit [Microvirga sp. BT325]|uniref:Efflux RND transporter permease subunit n=2 Tax=Microvirga splendida TaxID=2795727 RepID=A0ABS0XXN8_9HYPH|nr:efflux RND transporter permease subunit [Microvirga splendida]